MPYTWMYILAIIATGLSAVIAAILLAPSDVLGLNAQTVGWLGVAGSALGTIGGFLPRVTKPAEEARRGMD